MAVKCNHLITMHLRKTLSPFCRQAFWIIACLSAVCISRSCKSAQPFTQRERLVIDSSDSLMYVTVLPQDSTVLRTVSAELGAEELASDELKSLVSKMLTTVTDPSQDGVGIAAPQVGINRRIAWVQRLDKEGEPWACYLNLKIESYGGELVDGQEGCLSVPPMRGAVRRWSEVTVSYTDWLTGERVTETITGYTARIFQHETDHLDATLYIDRADSVWVSTEWAQERSAFDYSRPEWW